MSLRRRNHLLPLKLISQEKKGLPQIGFVDIIWGSEYHEIHPTMQRMKNLKENNFSWI